jgi:hypothetical protein
MLSETEGLSTRAYIFRNRNGEPAFFLFGQTFCLVPGQVVAQIEALPTLALVGWLSYDQTPFSLDCHTALGTLLVPSKVGIPLELGSAMMARMWH